MDSSTISAPSFRLSFSPTARRKRILSRGAGYRPVEDGDWKWLWAAYRKGDFNELDEVFVEDLAQKEFVWALTSLLEGERWFILEAKNAVRNEISPVGLVSGLPMDVYEPHVLWFWWATPRNKLECTVKFLGDAGRQVTTMVTAPKELARFFDRLGGGGDGRHGLRILRRIGTLHHKESGAFGLWQNA